MPEAFFTPTRVIVIVVFIIAIMWLFSHPNKIQNQSGGSIFGKPFRYGKMRPLNDEDDYDDVDEFDVADMIY